VQGVGEGDGPAEVGVGDEAGGGVVETSNVGVGLMIGVGVAAIFATGAGLHAVATSTSPNTAMVAHKLDRVMPV
jgi:hypothetical protein